MIDWYFVFVHSLWLLGASFVLAAFSYLDWYAQETEIARRELFGRPMWRVPASGGLLLVCLGLGLRRELPWWEQASWAVLSVIFVWGLVKAAIEMRAESRASAARQADVVARVVAAGGVVCPSCASVNIHRSRSRTKDEAARKQDTTARLFRCNNCDWRGWLEPQEGSGPKAPGSGLAEGEGGEGVS